MAYEKGSGFSYGEAASFIKDNGLRRNPNVRSVEIVRHGPWDFRVVATHIRGTVKRLVEHRGTSTGAYHYHRESVAKSATIR